MKASPDWNLCPLQPSIKAFGWEQQPGYEPHADHKSDHFIDGSGFWSLRKIYRGNMEPSRHLVWPLFLLLGPLCFCLVSGEPIGRGALTQQTCWICSFNPDLRDGSSPSSGTSVINCAGFSEPVSLNPVNEGFSGGSGLQGPWPLLVLYNHDHLKGVVVR